jgi:hypothetical protein
MDLRLSKAVGMQLAMREKQARRDERTRTTERLRPLLARWPRKRISNWHPNTMRCLNRLGNGSKVRVKR